MRYFEFSKNRRKGYIVTADLVEHNDNYFDSEGNQTNLRGYLVDPKTGDIVNNLNGDKMFDKKDLDEKGEILVPFNAEKYNFNPHLSREDFN